MSHGTSTEPVWQAPSLAYPEIEYVRWCRARASSGRNPGGLYTIIYERDRHLFEQERRERARLAREPDDLTELSEIVRWM